MFSSPLVPPFFIMAQKDSVISFSLLHGHSSLFLFSALLSVRAYARELFGPIYRFCRYWACLQSHHQKFNFGPVIRGLLSRLDRGVFGPPLSLGVLASFPLPDYRLETCPDRSRFGALSPSASYRAQDRCALLSFFWVVRAARVLLALLGISPVPMGPFAGSVLAPKCCVCGWILRRRGFLGPVSQEGLATALYPSFGS